MKLTNKEINNNFDFVIESFVKEYSQFQEPIRVNFRELVPDIKADRYTHLIHTYPAKLLCHIPYFFLQSDYLCPKGGTVLDPFCGTGTVLLEALIAGKNAYGADANPLARLITTAKTVYINENHLMRLLFQIISTAQNSDTGINSILNNTDFWYHKSTSEQLSRILKAVKEIESDRDRLFFEVCFSNLVKKVSYADPRISVPVKLNPNRFTDNIEIFNKVNEKLKSLDSINVYGKFEQICSENIERQNRLHSIELDKCKAFVISKDARNITTDMQSAEKLKNDSIDLILTSPPYAGAQKYIRSSSLNLGWLGIADSDELRNLDAKNIGRENYRKADISEPKTGIAIADKLLRQLYLEGKIERAHIVGNYINEMKAAIDESFRVLKKGGYFVMIIGNNQVCGYEFDTQDYLTQYMKSIGLELKFKLIDDIKSYGLMTKRNKTASRIACEWVLVFRK